MAAGVMPALAQSLSRPIEAIWLARRLQKLWLNFERLKQQRPNNPGLKGPLFSHVL
jgi:hypothetical protein